MRQWGIAFGACIGSTASYYVLAYAARHWSGDLSPSPLWLATAAATALALLLDRRLRWPIITGEAIGLVLAGRLLFDESWRGLVSPTLGNIVETILIVIVVDDIILEHRTLRLTREAMAVVGVIIAACALGGLIAVTDTTSNVIGGRFSSWWRWTLGDAVGELHLVGLALTYRTGLINTPRRRFPWELVSTIAAFAALGIIAFSIEVPVAFLLVPCVLWLAIRFGPVVAAPVAFVTAMAATVASGRGHGPFIEFGPESVVQVQLFNVAIALCALIGGGHALRAQNDHQRLVGVLASLPDIVVFRRRGGGVLSRWVPDDLKGPAALLEPATVGASDPFDDDAPTPVSALVTIDNDQVFERRTVAVDEARALDLYRDVSSERALDVERRQQEERAMQARLEEQRRIGQALHDSPVQLLASAMLQLGMAAEEHDEDIRISKALDLCGQAVVELRSTLDELIPPDVSRGEVAAALANVGRMLLDQGVQLAVEDDGDGPDLPPDICDVFFLVGREAIANAGLHGSPANVHVAVHRSADETALIVSDDGTGFAHGQRTRLGMTLMADRVRSVGGEMHVSSTRGAGTTVRIEIPHRTPEPDER